MAPGGSPLDGGLVARPARWRFLPAGELFRDVALVSLADGIVGVSFGASSVAGGLAWWVPVALSVLVFAGGSQIAAVGVVLGGGSPVAAVVAGAVLNTRLFPYGLAVADVIDGPNAAGPAKRLAARRRNRLAAANVAGSGDSDGPAGPFAAWHWNRLAARWLRRLAGPHLITDESVAFAMRQSSPQRRRSAFWTCGATLFAVWNATVLLGVVLGSAVRNTSAFGLDATFPAVMLALALPTLTSRPTRLAAGTGAVIAVALTPVLPAGLPLLVALGGLGTRWGGWPTWTKRSGQVHSRPRGQQAGPLDSGSRQLPEVERPRPVG